MSNKVDLKTINNNLSVEETLKVQEELRKAVEQTDTSKIPYSTEYLARELQYCLVPLGELSDLAYNLSEDIQEKLYLAIYDDFKLRGFNSIERASFGRIEKHTFGIMGTNIFCDAVYVMGQLILKEEINYMSILNVLTNIHQNLQCICEIDTYVRKYYADDESMYNRFISLAKEIFHNLHKLLNKIHNQYKTHYETEKETYIFTISHNSCEDMLCYNKQDISKLKKIYNSLNEFNMSVINIQENSKLYKYKDILEKAIVDLYDTLFSLAGNHYIWPIASKDSEEISIDFVNWFKSLENSKTCPVELSNVFKNIGLEEEENNSVVEVLTNPDISDKDIMKLYENLKRTVAECYKA